MTEIVPTIFTGVNARTPRAVRALATTLQRGVTLLDEGYCFLPAGAPGAYTVTSPGGATYQMIYSDEQGAYWCQCEAFNSLGCCKHICCLMLHKADIDQVIETAVAIHNAAAAEPVAARREMPAFDASDWK